MCGVCGEITSREGITVCVNSVRCSHDRRGVRRDEWWYHGEVGGGGDSIVSTSSSNSIGCWVLSVYSLMRAFRTRHERMLPRFGARLYATISCFISIVAPSRLQR